MIDQAIGETRLIVFDERDAIFSEDVRGRDDYEFVPINAGAEGDCFDFAAWNAAANGGSMEHVRQNHVVDVARLSRNFGAAFHARDRGADNRGVFHSNRGISRSFAGLCLLALVYDRQIESCAWELFLGNNISGDTPRRWALRGTCRR